MPAALLLCWGLAASNILPPPTAGVCCHIPAHTHLHPDVEFRVFHVSPVLSPSLLSNEWNRTTDVGQLKLQEAVWAVYHPPHTRTHTRTRTHTEQEWSNDYWQLSFNMQRFPLRQQTFHFGPALHRILAPVNHPDGLPPDPKGSHPRYPATSSPMCVKEADGEVMSLHLSVRERSAFCH